MIFVTHQHRVRQALLHAATVSCASAGRPAVTPEAGPRTDLIGLAPLAAPSRTVLVRPAQLLTSPPGCSPAGR